jgi:hypothetical protein
LIVKARSLAAALTLALGLTAGCADQVNDPVSMRQQMDRVEEASSLKLVDVSGVEHNAEFVLIDKDGGVIKDGKNGHELVIPRNAVQEPTFFSMGTLGLSKVVVKLVAYRARDLESVTRFPKALTLRLNYAKANVGNPHQLKIVYISGFDLEILEVFPTMSSGSGPYVEAEINHFSSYSMALD